MIHTVIYLFLSGIALSVGPCIGSCGPLLVSYTAGTKTGAKQILRVYLLFSLGKTCAYVLLGIVAGACAQLFAHGAFSLAVTKYVFFAGGLFIVFIGILMFFGKESPVKLCRFFNDVFIRKDAKSLFLFGVVIGLSPCGPLLGILSYVSLISLSWVKAAVYMFVFSLGTAVSPLAVFVVAAGYLPKLLVKNEVFFRMFQKACALIMCGFGVRLVYLAMKL